jgi:hypothetical protein
MLDWKCEGKYSHADNTHHCLDTKGILTESIQLSVNAYSLAGLNPSVVQIAFVAKEALNSQ